MTKSKVTASSTGIGDGQRKLLAISQHKCLTEDNSTKSFSFLNYNIFVGFIVRQT